MIDKINNLMLRRKYFPIENAISKCINREVFNFKNITLPPYHPSMLENGINFQDVPNLVNEVLENILEDLYDLKNKLSDTKTEDSLDDDYIKPIKKEINRKFFYKCENDGIRVFLPIIDNLFIEKDKIEPTISIAYNKGQYVALTPRPIDEKYDRDYCIDHFWISDELALPQELIEEYSMKELTVLPPRWKKFFCPYSWHMHAECRDGFKFLPNLGINTVFYKNLIIALDNAIIREKYSEQAMTTKK